ncbi:Phosphate acetyltransferase [BD1-7 clade bacterium]|uniref:Phosphate acetyltransferase n=1 Tax=BD1-7 clade bacterium TaxID=2029982 RepID=A0A5S9QH73_9GAMM|nr:Phosphate acetyltransferase [BD1-7 clade bacterium]CAA0117504.1 Phosphate acetyltransferase [BD1-7 clade bacterium]
MSGCLLVVPVGLSTGARSVSLGLYHMADQRGLHVSYFVPVMQKASSMIRLAGSEAAMDAQRLQEYMRVDKLDDALEMIVTAYEEQTQSAEFVITLGLTVNALVPYAERVNASLAKALDAKVLLVATDTEDNHGLMNSQLEIAAEAYGGVSAGRVVGCVINKSGAPRDRHGDIRPDLSSATSTEAVSAHTLAKTMPVLQRHDFDLFGVIPWQHHLVSSRTCDIASLFDVDWISRGQADTRRVSHISIGTRTTANLKSVFTFGTLLVTAGDRDDILQAAALAEMSGIELAGVLLTGGYLPSETTMQLIKPALERGLPVLSTSMDTYACGTRIPRLYSLMADDDGVRYQAVLDHIAEHIDGKKLRNVFDARSERKLSPAAFRYNLIKVARTLNKRVVLPEGDESRTLAAAIACAQKGIAHCILLGDRTRIESLAEAQGLEIPEGVSVVDPVSIREQYVDPFVALRKHKGMNEVRARQLLEDNVVLGTMMLHQDHVDGLVSGAVHTTANTILPAMQLIKTRPGVSLVSSVFFMCLPDQVLVYGDCAVNPEPDAQELADIAIQSADSAKAFGIPPRVAMISYSTGSSGHGKNVDKVVEATRIAKEQRPDLVIDGPLQYDAAANAGVAASKAPDSPVAGKATVFVFPDLNTGNTTYKAVQRSANVISVGPLLQGLKKPVNDLSRGALVDDIIYTIALTAIQAAS